MHALWKHRANLALFSWSMTALLRNSHIFVALKSEEISMKSMQQSISFVITTKMGPFVSIMQHIIFGKYVWCISKYHEMKMLLPVTSAKKWHEIVMLTVNIAIVFLRSYPWPAYTSINELSELEDTSHWNWYWNKRFLTWWPRPLTYDLDILTWPTVSSLIILSRASEVGSPTNHPGLRNVRMCHFICCHGPISVTARWIFLIFCMQICMDKPSSYSKIDYDRANICGFRMFFHHYGSGFYFLFYFFIFYSSLDPPDCLYQISFRSIVKWRRR